MASKKELSRKTKAELIDMIVASGQPEVEDQAVEQAEEAVAFFVKASNDAKASATRLREEAERRTLEDIEPGQELTLEYTLVEAP